KFDLHLYPYAQDIVYLLHVTYMELLLCWLSESFPACSRSPYACPLRHKIQPAYSVVKSRTRPLQLFPTRRSLLGIPRLASPQLRNLRKAATFTSRICLWANTTCMFLPL